MVYLNNNNMKTELLLLAMVDEEYLSQDKIFLHRYGKKWIAYEHSVLLLYRYFTPTKVQSVVIGPARLMYSVCHDINWIKDRAQEIEGVTLTYKNKEEIIIHCPTPVTEKEILKALEIIKSRNRHSLSNSIGQFFRKIYTRYKTYTFMRNVYMAFER